MGYLVLASLLWSVSFALIGQSGIDADLLAALRLGLAALVFVPFVARRGGGGRAAIGPRLLIGAVQFGLMYVLVLRAYGFLAAHEVALLTITTPLFVVAFDGLGERRARAAAGAALAVAGAFALRGAHGVGAESGSFWIGFALVQGANAAFAAGQIAYRRVAGAGTAGDAARGFAWLYLGGFAVASAVALTTVERADLALTREQALIVLYLGLVPSGLAFYLWNVGATRVGIGALAVMNNLKIPLAVAVALLPPFGGWRALDGMSAARLAASAVLLALALVVVTAPAGRTAKEAA